MHGTNRGRTLRGVFQDLDNQDTNFSNAVICDVDFTDADLTGAIFTIAKIKGADFTGANLTGAIFDQAVFGVKTSWNLLILIISLVLISLSGFSASILISCLFYFYLPTIRGIGKNISIIVISTAWITALHTVLKQLIHTYSKIDEGVLISFFIYIAICIIFIVGVFVPFIKVMDEYESSNKQIFFTIILFSMLLIAINLFLSTQAHPFDETIRRAFGALSGLIIGTIITHRSIKKKDRNYAWIFELFVHILSIHGTKFYRSTLDDASFVTTNITGSTFVECTAIRTNWENIKNIDCSRFKVHYLDNPQIRHLLTQKRIGKYNNWKDMNLRGLNISNAKLNGVDFSGSDFRGSTLNAAELKESNLSNTLLDNVDLSGKVDITGAIIGIKSIPPTAKVDGLICEYFHSESTLEQRYPINGVFGSEAAIKLLQQSSEIILTFKSGVIDWNAFKQSFKNCLKEFEISDDDYEKFIQAFEIESDIYKTSQTQNKNKISILH
ncbi:MAG: pentapeptide repeat-containing protein [Okeania sp. SIO2C2]|uniref:pentapeptide repeat-containing protein n=1 Tax=Okeania sp. SIO2C2 TaxID=2607787 RepID=UPI0013B63EDA|nr:pentapeptide repeat-containing protein [Okeania sp. SIO2C2]NEP87542.1 pentapeptide repeat-containing protein [Okeania sp. SIO2C2]